MDHHQDRTYAETDFPAQTEFTITRSSEGLEVTGTCPACGGLTSMTFDYGPPDGVKGLFRNKNSASLPETVTVYCECGYVHANRPESALDRGCGAFWKVKMP
ncbi:hypothetical protein GCM10022254_64230 [Actinomadura meridiana]|uniref:Uncharacterized protein n=1 Tax=Actinomadura meridiana TaxID=559626 RepID=A0ABP8CKM5_9ACTN